MTVYHYTDLKSGISILQDGFIEVPETIDNNIKSAIWFTKQSKYIPSTLNDNKSFDEKIKTVGCMRFVFHNEGELTTWKNFINNLKLQKRDYLEIMMNLDKAGSEFLLKNQFLLKYLQISGTGQMKTIFKRLLEKQNYSNKLQIILNINPFKLFGNINIQINL